MRRFFRVVTDWHRVLAFSGERRPIGRAITGACNLAFLFIIASGIYHLVAADLDAPPPAQHHHVQRQPAGQGP